MTSITLPRAAQAWKDGNFRDVLKAELEGLDAALLPLQQGLTHGSHVAGAGFSVMVLGVVEEEDALLAKVGVFYASIIAGCSCADDPTPIPDNPEYCELYIRIDRQTGVAQVGLAEELQ